MLGGQISLGNGSLRTKVYRANQMPTFGDKVKKFVERTFVTLPKLYRGELAIMHATLSAKVFRADGTVENLGVISRKKVTNAFVANIVANLESDTTAFGDYKYHDSGTGSTAEANTQTALVTPWGGSRDVGTQVDGGSGSAVTYTSVATTTYNSTFAIVEHGLFNNTSGATLMDRSVFSAINVGNGDSIQFTYVLTVNSEA